MKGDRVLTRKEMTPESHLKVGDTLFRRLHDEQVKLNYNIFMVANTLPDFSPVHKAILHFKPHSLPYVISLHQKFLQSQDNMVFAHKSFAAGLLCHYLTDYCCYPHFNNIRVKPSTLSDITTAFEHLRYEYQLETHLLKGWVKPENVITMQHDKTEPFETLVESVLDLYTNKASFEEDITFSVDLCYNALLNETL